MKKRVLSLFLAITLCLTLTPTGALATDVQPPEQTVVATQETETPTPAPQKEEPLPKQTIAATQETETPTPAPQKEEPTAPAENGADENASPASPDEKPTENTPAAPEKNPADEEPGKEPAAATRRDESKADGSPSDDDAAKVQNQFVMAAAAGPDEPTMMGQNNLLALADEGQTPANAQNGEGSGGTHYVAESGGTQYETVQEILDNMEEGEITLLDSVTEDLTVYAATTIHMNGHSITGKIDATDNSLTLNDGTVDGTVKVDGGTFTMTAPAEAKAAITGGLNVVSGSAFVSGAQVGVKGTLYFDGTDMLISGAVKAVELDSAAEPAAKTLYGSATVNGDTAAEAGFDTDTYKVGGEIAKKLTNKQVGSTTPAAPSLTLTETSKSLTAGKTAVFTANYTGTDTLNAYVQGNAVNGYFTISQKNNGDGIYTVSVKIDEETPGGTYTLFVHELGNTSVQASATITVTGLPDAAEVNGKQYKSLPRALDAAQDGDTVKLLADHVTDWDAVYASEEQPAVVKSRITLDLNGMTVDYLTVGDVVPDEEGGILESYDGNLTVVDNAQGGSCGKIKNLEFVKGSLAIQGGQIGGSLTCDGNSGTVTIRGGTVCYVTVGDGATVTVTGGTGHAGTWCNDGTLNITDATFGNVKFLNNGGTIAISGGTFGTITNINGSSSIPLMPLLADNYAFYQGDKAQNSTEKTLTNVTVRPHTHSFENGKCDCGVAAIVVDNNNSFYNTLQAALAAAANNATITSVTLGQDLTEDVMFSGSAAGSLTLNMNGHKLETEAGVPLTVTSGTLRIEGAAEINQNTASNATAFPAIALTGGKLVIAGDLTAQGGYDSSSGRKPAIYATAGELDLQGNVSLNGGLTITGTAKLTNPLTQGTFYVDASETGYAIAVTDSEVPGGEVYKKALELLAKDYAFYRANGSLADAGGFKLRTGTYTIKPHTCSYTHSIDLSTLLPKLTAPCDYGTITYNKKVDTNLGVGSFITLVDGKTGELTLEANRSGTGEGQFGTITVTISTSNYQDITLTVNVNAVNQIKPVPEDGKITASKITYGQALSDSTITGTMQDPNTRKEVTGTFTWDTPTEKLKAGSHNAEWTFTPDESYGGKYTTNTGTATVTVNPKKVTVSGIKANGKVYDGNTDAVLDCSKVTLVGVLENDTLTVTATGTFESADVGEKKVTISNLTLSGDSANNYVLAESGNQTETTATIDPKSIDDATVVVVLGKGLIANGAEQTQTVEKVPLGGKELPADSYTVKGNTATAPGSHTLTITAKGNYTGTVEQTYVIVPAKAEDAPDKEITIGNGKVKVDIKFEGTVPPATRPTDKAELLSTLVDSSDITADELAQIFYGANVNIVLTVKEANVSAEIKTAMAQAAKDYTIGQYLDISLLKYMTVNGIQQADALHTTKDALTISVVVPDALINTNSAVNRTYYIVRNHEGTIDVLDAAFDAAGKTLTFKTDRFSIYAIAYKDTAVPSSSSKPSSNNSSNDSETKKNEVAAPTPAPTPASTSKPSTITAMPQTGDTFNPTLYVVLLVASLLGLAVVFVCKKRNDK